ncbi:MAG: prolyl oligopeptidase family serine peptidase, partial [Candidatus Eremiobacterota bacterium]
MTENRLIPGEILFSDPVKGNPKISPSGEKIAYMAQVNNVLNLWVKTIDKEDDRPVTCFQKNGLKILIGPQKKDMTNYMWVTDRYIVYFHDTKGYINYNMYKINIETMESKNLTPCKDSRVRFVKYNSDFPYEMIISIKKHNQTHYDLYHIDIQSGKKTLIAGNPGNVKYWVIDSNLQILGMVSERDGTGEELSIRENGHGNWKKLLDFDKEGLLQNYILGTSKDNRKIYMIDSTGVNTCRVLKIDISTGISEVIASNPEYDIWEGEYFLYHPFTYEIQAVCFNKYRKEWILLDETIKEDFEAIRKMDSGDFSIVSRDDRDKIWIIAFDRDNGPVAYYIYNRGLKKGSLFFYHQPSLKEYTLSEMKDLSFISRDGLTIHGYITYPPGEKRNNLPLVLYVHGGPWLRDTWGYNPDAQWFANRGYLCLQINYRGSTGYGKDFLNRGNKEWGRKMQEDLVDGVEWAIKEGIADPEKIAIYGAGYGGYAALSGAVFTPDLFCCAIAIGCPGDLLNFIRSVPHNHHGQRKELVKRVGDPEKEKELLISTSPFYHLEKIKIPVFIAYGLKEKTINKNSSYYMVRAMHNRCIKVEYLVFHDEYFNISKEKNRIKLHLVAEKFLTRHMGGKLEERTAVSVDKPFNERELIEKILKEEDKEAFELLIEHYRKPLMKHLINMTGDIDLSLELLQETCLRVWTYLYTYSLDRSFFPWICKVATNVAIKHIKSETQESKLSIDAIDIDNMIIWDGNIENKTFIQSIINTLKKPYKTALFLRFIED